MSDYSEQNQASERAYLLDVLIKLGLKWTEEDITRIQALAYLQRENALIDAISTWAKTNGR